MSIIIPNKGLLRFSYMCGKVLGELGGANTGEDWETTPKEIGIVTHDEVDNGNGL
jgi:hypothetical protein